MHMRTDIPNVACPQRLMPGIKVRNIYPACLSFHMPEVVYVVASGPNGREAVNNIPPDAYTIACNTAITMDRRFTWWCGFDHRLINCSYWDTLDLKGALTLFGARLVNRLALQPQYATHKPRYFFEYMPMVLAPTKLHPEFKLTPVKDILMPGLLRGGMTVSGVALQFAYYGGAPNIVLCGVDMFGTGHHDGFENPDPHDLCAGRWPWADPLQHCCEAITNHGVNVYTMSDTALDLPRWNG